MSKDPFCDAYSCAVIERFADGCIYYHKKDSDLDCHLFCALTNCRLQFCNKNKRKFKTNVKICSIFINFVY